MSIHSCVLDPHLKDSLSRGATGKYGRMFPHLRGRGHKEDEAFLLTLTRAGAIMDADTWHDSNGISPDNPRIPSGFTYFGHLIAHNVTADRSLIHHHALLGELQNLRKPRLDLDSVYGGGPVGAPHLYDMEDGDKFLLGTNDVGRPDDLPRNSQGRALIGDPRDDVHLIISQLHMAFLKFHNAVVDYLRGQGVPSPDVYKEAQRLVRWHYQWIVIHEYLPLIAGEELVNDILVNGSKFYSFTKHPFIPVEFSDAAFRFGHSQVKSAYQLNDHEGGLIFPDFAGDRPVTHNRVIDWSYFFQVDGHRPPQPGKRIDIHIAHALFNMPASVVGATEIPEYHSLPCRDLLRAHSLDLPSGEAIARAMGLEPLSRDELGLNKLGWAGESPLEFYILREAEIQGGGERLGEVGGRIVTEVLLGLIDEDPTSYRNAETQWNPSLPGIQAGDFTMADFLRFAHVA